MSVMKSIQITRCPSLWIQWHWWVSEFPQLTTLTIVMGITNPIVLQWHFCSFMLALQPCCHFLHSLNTSLNIIILFITLKVFLMFYFFSFLQFLPVSLTFSPHTSSPSTLAFLTFHCTSPYYLPNISSAFLIASSAKGFGRLLYFLLISL